MFGGGRGLQLLERQQGLGHHLGRGEPRRAHQGSEGEEPRDNDGLCAHQERAGDQGPDGLPQAVWQGWKEGTVNKYYVRSRPASDIRSISPPGSCKAVRFSR